MRVSKPVSLAVSAAAALTAVPAVPAAQAAQRVAQAVPVADGIGRPGLPGCAVSGEREFPVRTRIHGGPDAYEAGGGYRTWYIDLTNTTDATCRHIHPVVVLVDDRRALTAEQPRLEFYDGERPRPVTFERTDEDEHIGVLGEGDGDGDGDGDDEGDGFSGFTVAPGETLSVKVRLAVTSDAVANDVVANAAVVQRQEDDGAWVGQSNDYRFRIVGIESESESERENGRESAGDGGGGGLEKEASGEPRRDAGVRERSPRGATDGVPDRLPFAEELAGTGLSSPRAVLAAAAGALLLLGAGTTALVLARRGGRGRR
ncbi:hypothetical protein QFZ75_004839 [Streptomyces sp. V3I8]|uniref:hypothetical protein n=1 Tax=Streptomyces sp. V3I8 TaxID=3042279 RepID=UPI0027838186|nr:hypothetical protein [Streptomyces sp. V3I8]MDQ1038423.1 hypothetical protein [Streptomyces sp. V3I8]